MDDIIETGREIVGIVEIYNIFHPVFNLKDDYGKLNIKADCIQDFEPIYIYHNSFYSQHLFPFISSRLTGRLTHYGVYGTNSEGIRISTHSKKLKDKNAYDLGNVFRIEDGRRVYIFRKERGLYRLKMEFMCSKCYTVDEYFGIINRLHKKKR